MESYVFDSKGTAYELPVLLGWEFLHSMTECDGFMVTLPIVEGLESRLSRAVEFRANHAGRTVFRGVVDEYELTADGNGAVAVISGRGYGAYLMDNEAESAEYWNPAMQQILDNHVYPWRISRVRYKNMECSGRFPVSSGKSQWKVLKEFCFFAGGITPRFDREGLLILDGGRGETVELSYAAITEQKIRKKCYGVFSHVLVKNTAAGVSTLVENPGAVGLCRRVVTVPRYTQYDNMRHTGQYQIAQSKKDEDVMTIATPVMFAAFAGDRLVLKNSPLGISGTFTVVTSRCTADASGGQTRLELIKEE